MASPVPSQGVKPKASTLASMPARQLGARPQRETAFTHSGRPRAAAPKKHSSSRGCSAGACSLSATKKGSKVAGTAAATPLRDRKSVVEGKRVDLGGRRIIKKKKTQRRHAAECAVQIKP